MHFTLSFTSVGQPEKKIKLHKHNIQS